MTVFQSSTTSSTSLVPIWKGYRFFVKHYAIVFAEKEQVRCALYLSNICITGFRDTEQGNKVFFSVGRSKKLVYNSTKRSKSLFASSSTMTVSDIISVSSALYYLRSTKLKATQLSARITHNARKLLSKYFFTSSPAPEYHSQIWLPVILTRLAALEHLWEFWRKYPIKNLAS